MNIYYIIIYFTLETMSNNNLNIVNTTNLVTNNENNNVTNIETNNVTNNVTNNENNNENNNVTNNEINRGTGAGGSNTNKNGLSYEKLTDLSTNYQVIKTSQYSNLIKFNEFDISFIETKQSNLFKYMNNNEKIDKSINKAHGCKNPDECYINEQSKTIFIIEKKFQQTSGSVCEKIQTSDFKVWQYNRTFPTYSIVYIYCLSDWFKDNCKAELEYLEYKNVPVFWGKNTTYKNDIINFIVNYR